MRHFDILKNTGAALVGVEAVEWSAGVAVGPDGHMVSAAVRAIVRSVVFHGCFNLASGVTARHDVCRGPDMRLKARNIYLKLVCK